MKKIIALFVIMLGFGFTANAQQAAKAPKAKATQSKPDPKEAAIQTAAMNDVNALNAFIPLSDAEKVSFKGLFEHKYRNLSENLSAERKALLSQSIEAKIKATLTPENVTKLEQNPKLLKQLTSSH